MRYSTADGSLVGELNGVNKVFTVDVPINPDTAQVFWNGQLRSGWTVDYYEPGETMTILCLRSVTVRKGLVPPNDELLPFQSYTLPTRDARTILMTGPAQRPGIPAGNRPVTITLDQAPGPNDEVVLFT